MSDIKSTLDRELLRSKTQSHALTEQLNRVRAIVVKEQEATEKKINRLRALREKHNVSP